MKVKDLIEELMKMDSEQTIYIELKNENKFKEVTTISNSNGCVIIREEEQ